MGIVKDRERGFSLVEAITVLVLVSILSMVVVSRLNVNPFREASFEQELRSAIRFAQKFAIASGCDVQVDVNAVADSYTLSLRTDVTAAPASCLASSTAFPLAAFGTPLPNPATGGNFTGTAPNGINITAGLTFFYNREGRPSGNGTITFGGQNIVIEAVTGYVR